MPAFQGQILDHEIVSVVCHERYTLGGADPTSEEWAEEYEEFCSEESPVFLALEAGEFSLLDEEVAPFVGAEGEFEITDVLNHFIDDGGVYAPHYEGQWHDAGTIESLLAASTMVAASET